jgi:adenylate kinase
MRLIFMGPPGSGKGTQAGLLSQRLGLCHFSTGDILRDAVRKDTAAGRLAKPFMSSGQLVPDDIVNEIVVSRFRAKDRPESFIMDGYPRTVIQAQRFDDVLKEQGLELDAVVLLNVDDQEIIRRLSGRQREDDSADTVRKRLEVFHDRYHDLLEYYRRRGLLIDVPGVGDVETIYESIVAALNRKTKNKTRNKKK